MQKFERLLYIATQIVPPADRKLLQNTHVFTAEVNTDERPAFLIEYNLNRHVLSHEYQEFPYNKVSISMCVSPEPAVLNFFTRRNVITSAPTARRIGFTQSTSNAQL